MKTRTVWIVALDVMWIAIAYTMSVMLPYGASQSHEQWTALRALAPFAVTTCVLWLLLSLIGKIDGFRGGWHFPAVISHVTIAVSVLMFVVLACGYLFHNFVSRLALAYFGGLLAIGFIAVRYLAQAWLTSRYGKGYMSKVVIIGWGRVAQELASKISRHPELLCEVVGFLCPREFVQDRVHGRVVTNPTKTSVSSVGVLALLQEKGINRVILALSRPAWPEVLKMADQFRAHGIAVSIIPHPYELYLSKPNFMDLDGLPLIQLQTEARSETPILKRALDLVLASVLLCLTSPIVCVAAIVLRIKKGRSFRAEDRCGQYGKSFRMWRLNIDRRTVIPGSIEQVLVRLGIVELPQVWNVLSGEMSLVGPRPESPERVKYYSEWQQQRLHVKPGITGLAQVHGLREHSSSEEKARFDLQYKVNQSVFLDLSLLLQTMWTVAGRIISESKNHFDGSNSVQLITTHTHERSFAVGEVLYSADSTQSSAD